MVIRPHNPSMLSLWHTSPLLGQNQRRKRWTEGAERAPVSTGGLGLLKPRELCVCDRLSLERYKELLYSPNLDHGGFQR